MNLADAQGRLARWRLCMAGFDFQAEFSPGATLQANNVLM
jgi:hypothetical protein